MAELIIPSPDWMKLDGISSDVVGIYVDTPPIPPMARQRYTTWKTGIDSDASSPDDVWENITLSFSCFCFMKNDNFNLAQIYEYVNGKKRLEFSRFPGRYFRIKQLSGVTPSQQYDGNKIRITISFICDPFKYHGTNEPIEPSTTGGNVSNGGTRFCRPVYTITHTNGCTMTVNGQVLTIAATAYNPSTDSNDSCPSPIVVDSERMIAYNPQNGANLTRFTSGFFPFLQPGMNSVRMSSGASVSIVKNERDL